MSDKQTTAELIASVIGMCLTTRGVIENVDVLNMDEPQEVLNLFSEKMQIAAGALMCLADELGCEEDMLKALREGQDRVLRANACSGLSGRA